MLNTIEKFIFGPQVAAEREFERIKARRVALQAEHAALTEQLRQIEDSAGGELLDSSDASALGRLGKKILQARTEAELIGRAIALASSREADANLVVQRAGIASLRAEAAAKRSQIVELEKKSAGPLEQLSAIHGVNFTTTILQAQPITGFLPADDFPLQQCSPGEMRGDITCAVYGVPLIRKLFNEARALDVESRHLETRLEKSLLAQREMTTPAVSPGGKVWSQLEHISGGSNRSLAT